jgi:hypothetical protein
MNEIIIVKQDLNLFLLVKWSKGHFFKKSCFSPVKNVKKCRGGGGRDLNLVLPVKKICSSHVI